MFWGHKELLLMATRYIGFCTGTDGDHYVWRLNGHYCVIFTPLHMPYAWTCGINLGFISEDSEEWGKYDLKKGEYQFWYIKLCSFYLEILVSAV